MWVNPEHSNICLIFVTLLLTFITFYYVFRIFRVWFKINEKTLRKNERIWLPRFWTFHPNRYLDCGITWESFQNQIQKFDLWQYSLWSKRTKKFVKLIMKSREAFGYSSHVEKTPTRKNPILIIPKVLRYSNNYIFINYYIQKPKCGVSYILWANFGFSVAAVPERNQL